MVSTGKLFCDKERELERVVEDFFRGMKESDCRNNSLARFLSKQVEKEKKTDGVSKTGKNLS